MQFLRLSGSEADSFFRMVCSSWAAWGGRHGGMSDGDRREGEVRGGEERGGV